MRFPQYQRYKDSGIEWLGELPAHWEVKRLRYLGEAIIGLTYDPTDVTEQNDEDGVLVLRSSNVQGGRIAFDDNVYVKSKIPERLITQIGDILVCSRNGSRALIGKNAIIDRRSSNLAFGAFMMVFRSSYNDYLQHVFNSSLFTFQSSSFLTATINQLTVGNLNSFKIPLPPTEDRSAIATFLDRETAKIDALVAEQQRLIELLKEKRQAVISHAVTKGLDPNAPMKDSGVEWLGEVPSHWRVGALRYFASFSTGSTPDRAVERYWNGGIPWVKTGEINYSTIMTTEETISPEGLASCSVSIAPPGTLLLALYGQGVTRGRVALLGIPATFNQACVAVQADKQMDGRFLHAFFVFAYPFIRGIGNETTQMNLNVEFVRQIRVVVPPISEQIEIVTNVEAEIARLDALVSDARCAIDLLQERRAALISAAVTGKIDVRGLADTGASSPEVVAA